MTRPLRLEFPGALYHVTGRGDRRHAIYRDDTDRYAWLEVLGLVAARFHFVIHAYCQMGNHYHLMVETAEGNLGQGMRQLNGIYSQRVNRRHGLVGHVFQGRYHALLVQKDAHLLELARYLVLNPVRAGMVDTPMRGIGAATIACSTGPASRTGSRSTGCSGSLAPAGSTRSQRIGNSSQPARHRTARSNACSISWYWAMTISPRAIAGTRRAPGWARCAGRNGGSPHSPCPSTRPPSPIATRRWRAPIGRPCLRWRRSVRTSRCRRERSAAPSNGMKAAPP